MGRLLEVDGGTSVKAMVPRKGHMRLDAATWKYYTSMGSPGLTGCGAGSGRAQRAAKKTTKKQQEDAMKITIQTYGVCTTAGSTQEQVLARALEVRKWYCGGCSRHVPDHFPLNHHSIYFKQHTQMEDDPILQDVCRMASDIVKARQEAQILRAEEDQRRSTASAVAKAARARTQAGLDGKGEKMAHMGLDHARRHRDSTANDFGAEFNGAATEDVEDVEEGGEGEDGTGSVLSNGTAGGSRGSNRRRQLEREQKERLAGVEQQRKEDDEKKKKNDPAWVIAEAVVDVSKSIKGTGAGEGVGGKTPFDTLAVKLVEKMEREQEDKDMEWVEKTDSMMHQRGITWEQLPPLMKAKWKRLNNILEDEEAAE